MPKHRGKKHRGKSRAIKKKVRLPATLKCHRGKKPRRGLYVQVHIRGRKFFCLVRKKRPHKMKPYLGSLAPGAAVLMPSYIA